MATAAFGRQSPEQALDAFEALMRLGLETSRTSGGSLGPFPGGGLNLPPACELADESAFAERSEAVAARIAAASDYDEPQFGTVLLGVKAGARGNVRQATMLLACRRARDEAGRDVFIGRGFVDGYRPEELLAAAASGRRGIRMGAEAVSDEAVALQQRLAPKGLGALARAMRSDRPGIVFAHAAAIGETDPLTDLDSRLFVGLGPG